MSTTFTLPPRRHSWGVDAICTSDRHFIEPIGEIEIWRPVRLADEFGLV
jgi:hypothetical protein